MKCNLFKVAAAARTQVQAWSSFFGEKKKAVSVERLTVLHVRFLGAGCPHLPVLIAAQCLQCMLQLGHHVRV